MLITENNTYKIGNHIVAAFGYETLKRRRVFQKVSDTTYRLDNSSKIVSYRSLTPLDKVLKNEKV